MHLPSLRPLLQRRQLSSAVRGGMTIAVAVFLLVAELLAPRTTLVPLWISDPDSGATRCVMLSPHDPPARDLIARVREHAAGRNRPDAYYVQSWRRELAGYYLQRDALTQPPGQGERSGDDLAPPLDGSGVVQASFDLAGSAGRAGSEGLAPSDAAAAHWRAHWRSEQERSEQLLRQLEASPRSEALSRMRLGAAVTAGYGGGALLSALAAALLSAGIYYREATRPIIPVVGLRSAVRIAVPSNWVRETPRRDRRWWSQQVPRFAAVALLGLLAWRLLPWIG